jgi:hypothetical protein
MAGDARRHMNHVMHAGRALCRLIGPVESGCTSDNHPTISRQSRKLGHRSERDEEGSLGRSAGPLAPI